MNKRKTFIPIPALLGALLLALVATMTPFVADRDIAHAQSAASITVGGKAVSDFALGTFDYTGSPIRVSAETTHIQVNATAVSGSRVHSIRYASDIAPSTSAGAVGDAGFATLPGAVASGGRVTLRSNQDTDIGVVIETGTAGTDRTGTIYVVTVTRVSSGANKNANLATLPITGIPTDATLVPGFDPDKTDYTLFVPYDVNDDGTPGSDEITLGPTLADGVTQTPTEGASFTITSDRDSEIGTDGVVELAQGRNVIRVMVEAANVVTKKTYTITVTRAAANASDDAALTSLMVGGKSVPASAIAYQATDNTAVDYTTKFPFATESVQVVAAKRHSGAQVVIKTGSTAAAAAGTAGVIDTDGRVSLPDGTAVFIAVQVTAEDGKSDSRRNYILEVTRVASDAASNANLATLPVTGIPNGVALAPAFGADITSYSLFVPYDVDGGTPEDVDDEITIAPTLADASSTPPATFEIMSDQDSEIATGGVVELKVGRNVITIVVEAADVVTKKTYTITVTRAAEAGSDDATLSALTVGGESVSVSGFTSTASTATPTDADVDYTTKVPTTVQRVLVAATPTDSSAVVVIRSGAAIGDALAAPIDTDGRIGLDAGTPVFITLQVTAADGETVNNYILSVTRASPTASKVANLTNLTITAPTGITVAPTFDADVTSYMASVPHDVDANVSGATAAVDDEITLTLPPATGATVEVTSDMDDAIATTTTDNEYVVELAEGANVITIMVEAEDAVTTKTYTLTVTRSAQSGSDDASLSSLMVGTETVSLPLPVYVSANAAATTYVTGVPNAVNSIQIVATPTHAGATAVIRTAATANAAVTGTIDADGNIPLIVGYTNFIAVQVMAEDGKAASNKTYMLQVNRAPASTSSNAKLSALGLTAPPTSLKPVFDADTMAYTAEVGSAVASVTVTATGFVDGSTPANSATVRVMSDTSKVAGDTVAALNDASNVVTLIPGANVITVMVTAANYAATNTYTVTVTRAPSADDATLSSLTLKHLPMNMMEGMAIELTDMDGMAMAFDSAEMMYYADAGEAAKITVTAKATSASASVAVTVGGTAAMKTDIPMYWDMLGCPAMNDAVRMYDDHNHPDDATSPYCTTYNMDDTHPGLSDDAKAVVNMTFANYYDVPLMVGDNMVAVTVTSEDETENMTYTVTVTREDLSDRARLLRIYDTNDDDEIDDGELNAAIDAYLEGDVTDADLNILIDLYLG